MSALRKEAFEYEYGYETLEKPKKKVSIKPKKKNKIFVDSFKNSAKIGATFVLGILLVYNYATITDKQMELSSLNEQIAELNNDLDKYNISLESIKNTNKIEEVAKSYLGMNYPTRKQTVFLDFAYAGSGVTEEESNVPTKDNMLYGFIDKVIGFIQ